MGASSNGITSTTVPNGEIELRVAVTGSGPLILRIHGSRFRPLTNVSS